MGCENKFVSDASKDSNQSHSFSRSKDLKSKSTKREKKSRCLEGDMWLAEVCRYQGPMENIQQIPENMRKLPHKIRDVQTQVPFHQPEFLCHLLILYVFSQQHEIVVFVVMPGEDQEQHGTFKLDGCSNLGAMMFWMVWWTKKNSLYPPWRLTWNIIMEVWKIILLSKWVICRFHVNLPGCIQNIQIKTAGINNMMYINYKCP